MAEYFFSRHNPEGFSPNDNLIQILKTNYNCGSSNPDVSGCNAVTAYLEKQGEKTTVDAIAEDMSNQFSYQKMKTWNLALGVAFLGGYLYYKNY
jgi:hypothetical protein